MLDGVARAFAFPSSPFCSEFVKDVSSLVFTKFFDVERGLFFVSITTWSGRFGDGFFLGELS